MSVIVRPGSQLPRAKRGTTTQVPSRRVSFNISSQLMRSRTFEGIPVLPKITQFSQIVLVDEVAVVADVLPSLVMAPYRAA